MGWFSGTTVRKHRSKIEQRGKKTEMQLQQWPQSITQKALKHGTPPEVFLLRQGAGPFYCPTVTGQWIWAAPGEEA